MSQDEGRSLYQDAWIRLRRDRIAITCLAIIVLYTLVAILAETGLLFANWNDPVGDPFEMKDLPPMTVVWAHEIGKEEAAALPPQVKTHREEREGNEVTYRMFRGKASAVEHYFRTLEAEGEELVPPQVAEAAAAQWKLLSAELRRWILDLPMPDRDKVIAAGGLLWERLRPGGLIMDEDIDYASENFGLDAGDLTELNQEATRVWNSIAEDCRGWIQTHPPAIRRALVRAGPVFWQGAEAAGLGPELASTSSGNEALPDGASALWVDAFERSLSYRPLGLRSWLRSLPEDERAQHLEDGARSLAYLSIERLELETSTLLESGYWRVHRFLLGSDKSGRDALRLVTHGTKISMKVGLFVSLISIPIGVVLGACAGYFGGRIDSLIVWLYTTLACVPGLLLIMAIAWAVGGGLMAIYVALGATTWVQLCRLIRGEFLKIREQDYVTAATALGARSGRIIFRHMMPNAMHLVIITLSLRFVYAILSEVVLSYIGVGVDTTQPSWGRLIFDTQQDLASKGHWWIFTGTSLAMFFIVLAFNIFGDALRDALDPKLKT